MVKISQDAQLADVNLNSPEDRMVTRAKKELESATNSSGVSQLPPPDLKLVAEARELLKNLYESDPDKSEQIYSKYHYDELMEPDAPYTCWRYLLHRDQNVAQAFELMKQTLAWRKENRIDEIDCSRELIKDFWLRAPIGFIGRTKSGLDLIYAIGKNFKKPDASIKQVIRDFIGFLLFDWDRKHRYTMDQFSLVFDVSDTGFRNIDLDFAAWLVSIRDYVPARVNAIYFVGMPYLIRPIIKLIISWLPERYRRIAYCGSFDELVRQNIEDHYLPEEVGGPVESTWRLAPPDTKWAHESELPNADKMFAKICEACSFNTTQAQLDRLYQMQRDYERRLVQN